MKKRVMILVLCCCLFTAISGQAEKPPANSPLDWEISIQPKPDEQEIERNRWAGVFANDIGIYAFDHKSMHLDEADRNVVHVLTKTIFTDPKVIASLNEKYKEKLPAEDEVSYSEMQMVFQIKQKTYAVIGTKVFSKQGKLLEDRQQTVKFADIPVKTFAESMYDIAKNYQINN